MPEPAAAPGPAPGAAASAASSAPGPLAPAPVDMTLTYRIFCEGPLLQAVQEARLFEDSKTFVDMPLLCEPADALAAFGGLCRAAAADPYAAVPPLDDARTDDEAPARGPPWRAAPDPADVAAFVARHFGPPGSDLLPVTPPDFAPEPPEDLFLPHLGPAARAWALRMHALWPALCRDVAPEARAQPTRRTLLPVPHTTVVPGDRFRESYYWDSYAIARGLVVSGMHQTAAGVALNLVALAGATGGGHVPNGGRLYYLNRTQPPLLAPLVDLVLSCLDAAAAAAAAAAASDAAASVPAAPPSSSGGGGDGPAPSPAAPPMTPAESFLRAALPALMAEHAAFTSGQRAVRLRADAGASSGAGGVDSVYTLSRYSAAWDRPRPESYREDAATAGPAAAAARADPASASAASAPARLWRELASAAESGWDFSSRWVPPPEQGEGGGPAGGPSPEAASGRSATAGPSTTGGSSSSSSFRLADLKTQSVLPADLNGFLYRLETHLSCFHARLGDAGAARAFAGAAQRRRAAMDALLWRPEAGRWEDVWLTDAGRDAADAGEVLEAPPAAGHVRPHAPADAGPGLGEGGAGALDRPFPPRGVYASSWVPLWCGCAAGDAAMGAAAVAGLEASGLIGPGGISTSTVESGEQWDGPNSWPPLNLFLIEACADHGGPRGRRLAQEMAAVWLRGALIAHAATGQMHEKYSAHVPGGVGRGGEYAPQVGFGWSNGVALALLARFGLRECDAKQAEWPSPGGLISV